MTAGMNALNLKGLAELKQRALFLLLALVIYRIGAHIPVPGLDASKLSEIFSTTNSIFGLINHFSGGALARLTIFALGVMPYITSSIVVQLLTTVMPQLEQLKKEGHTGRRKITQYTRYLTVLLCTVQGFGVAKFLASTGVAFSVGVKFYCVTTLTLVAGTMFLMWLGEQITERGIGNGISMLIFASIVSSLPSSIANTLESVRQGQIQVLGLLLLIVLMAAITFFIVFMERGQRRISVNYAKRQQARGSYTVPKSHLPLKINMAGVIPPIFASTMIMFPRTLSELFGRNNEQFSWLADISMALSQGQPLYLCLFAAAVVCFSFFYTGLVFNPKETADNLKKSGGYIPGIRPGEQTAKYIEKVMMRLTVIGAAYIAFVSLLPEFLVMGWQVPFYFGGTSLLIIVVVVMDFIAQVQAHLMSHQYEGLMKKSNLRGFR